MEKFLKDLTGLRSNQFVILIIITIIITIIPLVAYKFILKWIYSSSCAALGVEGV